MSDNPDHYRLWLLHRLEHIENLMAVHSEASAEKLEKIAIDVAILKNEAKNAEKHAKKQASIIAGTISAVVAFIATVWQTYVIR